MNSLVPIEHKNQRVLTTQQLADGYETETERIRQNFMRNQDRYILGIHYFILEGEELQAFKGEVSNCYLAPNINKFMLWTEKGTLLHAKSLNTDKAWEVYEMLVENYFHQKMTPQLLIATALIEAQKLIESKDEVIALMKPKAEFFDAVANSKDAIEMSQAAKVLNYGKGRNVLFRILRSEGILRDNNEPYQEYVDRGYFRVVEQKYTKPDGTTCISIKTLVYQKGLDYIRKVLDRQKALSA
ncbi:MAG: phage antirepressor KilAC domain-containing protein [Candidatus Babeliales bacterium]|jgi:phage antirepressor YoqD-like protein